jgi:RimJ/RimL family protein N-acetyltransferase
MTEPDIRLEPWGPGDLPLLRATLADPAMTTFVGGPETEEKLVERQARFEAMADGATGRMFKIVDVASGEAAGSVGYWDRPRGNDAVYEMGWFVLPAFQGRGIASAATRLALDRARSDGAHRYAHAFPSVENEASNALCRSVGFTLMGSERFEYPPGSFMTCNDWRYDLTPGA